MNAARDQVTIITVTYESARIVATLAATLNRFKQVIVVDNASKDGTADLLERMVPHARLLRNQQNTGFGPANNQAVALASTSYVLLLNPDCEIDEAALERLLETANDYPSAAIVAPQGWYSKNKPQPSYRHAFYEKRAPQPYHIPEGTCSAKWLHGCCMLIRVSAFRQFGGFDERFFLYYEDDDLCLRALNAGYECLLEPRAHVMHLGGGSSTPSWRTELKKHFYFFRSRHLIIQTYQGKYAASLYRFKTALAAPLAALIYSLLGQRKHALKWLGWGVSAWRM